MMRGDFLLALLFSLVSIAFATSTFQKKETLAISTDVHFNRTIKIGAPISFDMDDLHFSSGRETKQAWTMFVEWVNNEGGIFFQGENVSITLVCIEDFSEPEYVEESLHYLLDMSPSIDVFLAPYSRYYYHNFISFGVLFVYF